MKRFFKSVVLCMMAAPASMVFAQNCPLTTTPTNAPTQIVFLGTGTPTPDPDRQGPAFVIQTAGNTYLFDMGVGLMRQAAKSTRQGTTVNLNPPTAAFLSHLHTDHTMGLPDLMFTPWSGGVGKTAKFPICLYGPEGLEWMVNSILAAYRQDICVRNVCERWSSDNYQKPEVHEVSFGNNTPTGGPTSPNPMGQSPSCKACDQDCKDGTNDDFNCTCGPELTDGYPQEVYKDRAVRVSAFLVRHGCWDVALGYVIQTKDNKRIVYSGDTRYVKYMGAMCNGCDVLIHEIAWNAGKAACGMYDNCFHTSPDGLKTIIRQGKPKQLVVVHQVGSGSLQDLGLTQCTSSSSSNSATCGILASDLQVVVP